MRRLPRIFFTLLALALVATACGDDDAAPPETIVVTSIVEVPGETVTSIVTEIVTETSIVTEVVPGENITFWSTEDQPERMAITQGIIDRFTAETGIGVTLVGTNEPELPGLIVSNAASGTLPDVMFHPLDFTVGLAQQGLLDTDAAAAVVEDLGAETFSQGALSLVTVDGKPAAVPADGWGQLLLYRRDLFDAAGLEAPDTFDKILTAAQTLHDPDNNLFGITAATERATFTQQTFEHFALANGCELIDEAGNVLIESPECVEAMDFFADLLESYSPGGTQTVVSTRSTYFAGQAAMIVWSPFILDEMAGLRDAAFPACDECAADVAFLAKNTGIVPAFAGPSGAPAQYGQISYMGITTSANTAAAQEFVKFWLSDGYLDWLSTSVEGKFPMRRGTADNPTEYLDGWKQLETGVDRKAPLSDFYPDEVIDLLIEGSDNFSRWGFNQGYGDLIAAIYASLPVVDGVIAAYEGSDAADLVEDIKELVEDEISLLEE